MTHAPKDKHVEFENMPEPPLWELYALYIESMECDQKKWDAMAAGNKTLLNANAEITEPVSIERFEHYLEECEANGTRQWLVNLLVLGREYTEAHPEDPRVQDPRQSRENRGGFVR